MSTVSMELEVAVEQLSPGGSSSGDENSSLGDGRVVRHKASGVVALRERSVPPCRICQGPGSGIHYGVNTCVACKVFFRRYIGKETKPCKNRSNHECGISKNGYFTCAHCRLKRCEALGMSIQAIQYGRYTLKKKTRDIIETKRLAAERARVVEISAMVSEFRDTLVKAQQNTLDHWRPFLHKTEPIASFLPPQIAVGRPLQPCITDGVKEGSRGYLGGGGSVPSHSAFLFSYVNFGTEIDDRLKDLRAFTRVFETGLRHIVDMMKQVPGFRELNKQDQIAVIRQSFLEIMIVTRHELHDHVRREAKYWSEEEKCFRVIRLDQILPDPDICSLFLVAMRNLKLLGLSVEEACLLKVLAAFLPGHDVLQEPEKVEQIFETSMNSLWYLLEKRIGPERCGLRFARMVGALTHLKKVSHFVQAYLESTILEFGNRQIIDLPPLFKETLTPL